MRKKAIRPSLYDCTLAELKQWMADYFRLMNCDVKSITDYVLVAIRWLDHKDQKFTNDSYIYPDNESVNQRPFSINDVFEKIIARRDEIDSLRDFGKGQISKDWQLSYQKTQQKPMLVTRDRIKYIMFWMVHCGILDVATRHHDKTGQMKNYNPGPRRRPCYVFWLREVPNRFTLHPLRVYRTLWEVNNPDKKIAEKKAVRIVPPSWIINKSDDVMIVSDDVMSAFNDLMPDIPVEEPPVWMPRPVQPSLFNQRTIDVLKDELTTKKEDERKCNREIRRFNTSYRSAKYEDGKLFIGMRLTPEQAKLLVYEVSQISDQVRTLDKDIWPDTELEV